MKLSLPVNGNLASPPKIALSALIFPLAVTVVNAPVVGVVAPTVPLISIDAVPLKVPPKVKLPDVVTVPVKVKPLTVPVPLTLVTDPEAPALDANNVTVPALFFAYSFMSAMFKPSSPLAKLPDVGTAEAVVL